MSGLFSHVELSSLSSCIIEEEFRNYFLDVPGKEHYTLLAHISSQLNDVPLLDIGTYKGCSALALSYNQQNQVHSFDIVDARAIQNMPSNIQFYVDDILDIKFKELVLSSPFILVDTLHDGIFEKQFHTFLQAISWNGTLMLDDIYLNDAMKEYWNAITEKKVDVSSSGHWSGTGMVFFGETL